MHFKNNIIHFLKVHIEKKKLYNKYFSVDSDLSKNRNEATMTYVRENVIYF